MERRSSAQLLTGECREDRRNGCAVDPIRVHAIESSEQNVAVIYKCRCVLVELGVAHVRVVTRRRSKAIAERRYDV
jgi:hypothetical protein